MSRELDAQVAVMAGEITLTEHAARLRGVWPNTPAADMTPAQLDWALALHLGWEQAEIPARDGYVSLPDPPAYSTDLNACAQAEARVIGMGLGDLYAQTLEANIRADLYAADGYWADWRAALLTASAEARCRAMLQAVGERE